MQTDFGKMIEVTDEDTRIGYQYYHQVILSDFLDGLLERYKIEKTGRGNIHYRKCRKGKTKEIKRTDSMSYNDLYTKS